MDYVKKRPSKAKFETTTTVVPVSRKSSILTLEQLTDTVQQLSLARDIQSIAAIVRTIARSVTGADGASIVLREADMCHYVDEDAISPLWKGSRFPMSNCVSGWVMLNRVPALIEDIYRDERVPHNAYRPTFVKSLAMVPIRSAEPIGAIGNYWASNHVPTEPEVAALQALADITAVSIENIQIRNELSIKLAEREKMLGALQKQKIQLEEFTYIVAHNIRAPLTNLMLLNDMMHQAKNDADKLELLDKQIPVISFLNEICDELVDAIHVKTNFELERDHIDLQHTFEKVVELLQGEIIETKATVEADFAEADTAWFPHRYMDSILFNLVSNALKYRHPDRPPRVMVRAYKSERWTWLEVSDNGLGIDLKRHGENVFKLRKTFHVHPQAKGFGLFITKTQVEAMGGTISIDSVPNVGTTLTIKLFENK